MVLTDVGFMSWLLEAEDVLRLLASGAFKVCLDNLSTVCDA